MNVNRLDKTNFTSRPVHAKDLAELKTAIKKGQAFLYDVDTTHAFMDQGFTIRRDGLKDGFPVAGADEIIPALVKIKKIARGFLPKFETVDAHKIGDPELDTFKAISDIHSEKGTEGAEKIAETVFGKPDILIEVEPEKADVPSIERIKEVLASKGIIHLEKNETNPLRYGVAATKEVVDNEKGLAFFENLKKAGARIALIYGVATDFCVKDAAAACKKFGIKPIVIEDGIKEAINNSIKDMNDPVYHNLATMTTKQLGKVLDKVQ